VNKDQKFLTALALGAIPFGVALVFLMTAVFGSPSIGLKCWRREGDRQCAILQSRFFGLTGNSSVVIPESSIARAVTLRPVHGVGSRGSGSYTVSLELKSGPYRYYPVLSGKFFEATDASTRRLNAYFADPNARSIELHENMWASVLVPFIPVALIAVVAIVAVRSRRQLPKT
jgi:hypothetical protein